MNSYSIWVKMNRFPPVLVRLLARLSGRLMSDDQILETAVTLTRADIKWLSYSPTWDEIPVRKMREFCVACGVDFSDRAKMRSVTRYLKSDPKFTHLRRDPNFHEYREMLSIYLNYLQNENH